MRPHPVGRLVRATQQGEDVADLFGVVLRFGAGQVQQGLLEAKRSDLNTLPYEKRGGISSPSTIRPWLSGNQKVTLFKHIKGCITAQHRSIVDLISFASRRPA